MHHTSNRAEKTSDAPTPDHRDRIRGIAGACAGNLVEWFDFFAYAFTSIYFAGAFLPGR